MTLAARLAKTLRDATPLYAVAGASDIVVEKLRRQAATLRKELEGKVIRDWLRVGVERLHRQARARRTAAATTYDDLAARGRDVVRGIRREKPVQELTEQAEEKVRRARAARASVPVLRGRALPSIGAGNRGPASDL